MQKAASKAMVATVVGNVSGGQKHASEELFYRCNL